MPFQKMALDDHAEYPVDSVTVPYRHRLAPIASTHLSRPRNSEQFQPADKLELPWFMVVKYTDAGVR